MRKWFPGLRAVACLRRIAVALEEANELQRQWMAMQYPAWRASAAGRKTRLAEVSVARVSDWNERWMGPER
jgi:hypothetical protein